MNKLFLSSSVSALALMLATSSAFAQAAAPAGGSDVESVTVTGVRASVEGALNVKQNATQLQDSIVSEDIGKLPDSTVVEALQHVSGIEIVRNSVEPSTVLIRGLPDIATLLNGREIFSAAGRFVSLPDFPAELLAQVDVHKASSATDLEGGIAGLIDIRLHRPFDFDGLTLAGGLQAVNESLAGHVDPEGSILVSNRWHTDIGEVGFLMDFSYKSIHNQEDQILEGPRANLTAGPVANAGTTIGAPVCTTGATCPTALTPTSSGVRAGYAALPNSVTFYQRQGLIERASVDASGQWKPNNNISTFAEIFYTRLRQKAPTDVDVFLDSTKNDPVNTTAFTASNIVQSAQSSGYSITSLQDLRVKEDTYQAATGGEWVVSNNLSFKTEIDETVSKYLSTNYIPDTEYNYGTDGLSIANNGTGGVVANTPGNPQLNPANLYSDQWYDQENVKRGSEFDARVDGEYDFAQEDFVKSVEFGVRYADRTAKNLQPSNSGIGCAGLTSQPNLAYNQYLVGAINAPACSSYNAQTTANSIGGISLASQGPQVYSVNHGSFFGGAYGVSNWINVNPEWLVANTNTYRALFGYTGPQAFVNTNTYGTNEQSDAGYVKANFGFPVLGFPVDGNLGMRYVVTNLTESAYTSSYVAATCAAVAAASPLASCLTYTPTVARKTTDDFLPSINIKATLDTNLFLRIAASETVTHPTFAQLNPGTTLSAPTATLLGSATSGNANLNPEKSQNEDVDLEYYWGAANHVSAAVFNRDVSGYIQTVASTTVINGVSYQLSAPANVQNGDIQGVEVGYSQFLDFLPGFLSGFGWDTNGTYVSGPFNNISKWHFNGAGIYEYDAYSFRLSYTWSSSYKVGQINTGGIGPQTTFASPRENLDASFNYRWDDHLTFTLDATNIINSEYKDHYGAGSLNQQLYPEDVEEFDKTFSIGVRYKM